MTTPTSGGVNEIPALLFQHLMYQLNITTSRLEAMISQHLLTRKYVTGNDPKAFNTKKSSFRQKLLATGRKGAEHRKTMTWDEFCENIEFLGFDDFTITVILHHAHKKATSHTYTVDLRGIKDGNASHKLALATLYHGIHIDFGIDDAEFRKLADQYLINQPTYQKSNLDKALRPWSKKSPREGTMTWKSFCQGIKFLNVPKMTVKIKVSDKFGSTFQVQQTVVLKQHDLNQ